MWKRWALGGGGCGSRREAGGRRQEAGGRRQEAGGSQVAWASAESVSLHTDVEAHPELAAFRDPNSRTPPFEAKSVREDGSMRCLHRIEAARQSPASVLTKFRFVMSVRFLQLTRLASMTDLVSQPYVA
jgi:hypothetical protein